MTSVITNAESPQPETEIRERIRGFIEELIRGELDAALARPRYGWPAKSIEDADSAADAVGHRHGSRRRTLMGTFGKAEIDVPRARLQTSDGKTKPASSLRVMDNASVAQCQKPTCAVQQRQPLFDHLVGAREQHRWHVDADRLGGLEVDDGLELGRPLDRLGAFQNLVDERSRPAQRAE
jgi:hypothetical protein